MPVRGGEIKMDEPQGNSGDGNSFIFESSLKIFSLPFICKDEKLYREKCWTIRGRDDRKRGGTWRE